jgi:sortase A
MKVVVNQEPAQVLLRALSRTLMLIGVGLLVYCVYVVADTWWFQAQGQRALQSIQPESSTTLRQAPFARAAPAPDGLIGRIDIERLGLSAVVMEGTGKLTLRRAVGHIEGTAFPGQEGNVGLSAHRDTFFRPLRNIREDDLITLTTQEGEYRYRVVSMRVVGPSDIGVLKPVGGEVLTLVTCYPFYFAGPAPQRFIVHAARETGGQSGE